LSGDCRRRFAHAALGVLALLMMPVFGVWSSVCAQDAETAGAAPPADSAHAPAAPGGKVQLLPAERKWLSGHDGQIRIGVTIVPPQVIYDNGEYKGLSIDYIRLMERNLGCRFTLVPFATRDDLFEAARERRIDMVFAAQKTPQRETYLRFTKPYLAMPVVILTRKDKEGGEKLDEMKGWTVAVVASSANEEFLGRFGELRLHPVSDEVGGLMHLSLGEVDAMVIETARASYYIDKAEIVNLRISGDTGIFYSPRFAVRKDWPELCGILDKGLDSVTGAEKREIAQKWMPLGGGMLSSRLLWTWAGAVAGVILLAAVLVMAWVRSLRVLVAQRTSQLRRELAERQAAEQALRRSEATIRSVLATTPVGICIVKDRRFQVTNRCWREITGYSEQDAIGRNSRML
jgi:ABC-type amino acid transport substrate-binding protein